MFYIGSLDLDHTLLGILKPPVFDDLDKTRIARLLNTISLAIFGLLIIVSLVSPFLFQDPGYGVILSGITALPVLGVLWLVRVGRVHLASQLFVLRNLALGYDSDLWDGRFAKRRYSRICSRCCFSRVVLRKTFSFIPYCVDGSSRVRDGLPGS